MLSGPSEIPNATCELSTLMRHAIWRHTHKYLQKPLYSVIFSDLLLYHPLSPPLQYLSSEALQTRGRGSTAGTAAGPQARLDGRLGGRRGFSNFLKGSQG